MADLNKAPTQVQTHGESFTIEFCDKNRKEKTSLQDSFLKFKKAKQREIQANKKMKRKRRKKQKNPEQMQKLREKFIEKAKKYYGVPYARKYWPPESEEYNSKLFLDCCGLVRQVVRDLSKDFGFHIGPWNQAYMYDTLPITIEREEDMKPGDLVFMSGIYPNPKSRQQKHNMTHVEIWAGQGKKTIGARWNSGKVQLWDSYMFEAKSFHSAQYYFKSIDTWLMGICKSFCPEHKWKRRKFRPEKKSIFKETDLRTTSEMKEKSQKNEENEKEKIEDVAADDIEDQSKQDQEAGSMSATSDTDGSQDSDLEGDNSSDSDNDDDLNASPDELDSSEVESTTGSVGIQSRSGATSSTYYFGKQAMQGYKWQNNNQMQEGGRPTSQNVVKQRPTSNISQTDLRKSKSPRKNGIDSDYICRQHDLAMTFKNNCNVSDKMASTMMKSKSDHILSTNPANPCLVLEHSTDSNTSLPSSVEEINDSDMLPRGDYSGDVDTEKQVENNQTKEEEAKRAKRAGGKKSPGTRLTKLPSCSLPNNMQPTFYVGGGNGVALVEGPLLGLGWKRTIDKYDERYRLKWVECKTRINYSTFKEGEQLVNHIPNCQLLTNKLGLLNSLQEYERVTLTTKGRPPRLRFSDFVPETFRFDEKNDREAFLERYKDDEMWICKPTGLNQGKGIFLIRDRDELNKMIEEREQKKEQMAKSSRAMMTRIVQRYILNPLLLDDRKFDIRSYMLIASTTPYLVLYHKGYVRLCCNKYNQEDKEMSTHLTNQFVQKKDPAYKEFKENTAWTMDKFNEYINENVGPKAGVEEDWVYNTLTKQMQKIMIHCFNSVKHKLQSRVGYFELYGLDFMVDTDMKVWLIEININPALHINCEALKEVIPGVVEESLYVSIECFEKTRKNQALLPLNSLKGYSVLYCGTRPYNVPTRASRSVSPTKDMNSVSDRNKGSAPSVATAPIRRTSPVRIGHRMSTASTPVISARNNTANSQDQSKTADNKKNSQTEVAENESKLEAISQRSAVKPITDINEANLLLRQSSALLQENVKLKMIQGDGILSSLEKNSKQGKDESNGEKDITTPVSEGIVLNLTPTVSTATEQGKSSAALTETTTVTSGVSNSAVKSSAITSVAKTNPTDTDVATVGPSKPNATAISQLPTSIQGNGSSVINTTTIGSTPAAKTSSVSTNGANVTVSSSTLKQNVSFPVITNTGAKNSKNFSNNQSANSRSSREGNVKNSTSGGLSSNPYSLTNSSLAKLQNASVYTNTSAPRANQTAASASMSTASLKLMTTTAYSKPLSIPSVTISDSVVGPKTIATLTLTSSKNGPHGRTEVRSSRKRSRDRDKPDRGN